MKDFYSMKLQYRLRHTYLAFSGSGELFENNEMQSYTTSTQVVNSEPPLNRGLFRTFVPNQLLPAVWQEVRINVNIISGPEYGQPVGAVYLLFGFKQETPAQCFFNVGPASKTLAQQ